MSAAGAIRSNAAEALIGALVVAVAVLFLAFAYMRTGSGSLSGYEINVRLAKADGLAIGTDVRVSGIKVGSVSDLTLDPRTFLVTVHMSIRDDIKIPTDSSVLVTSAGLLGSQYLSITPGGDDTVLPPGGTIANAQGSVDVMSLVGRFMGEGGASKGGQQQPKPAPLPPGPSP
jgi:phospholipid/cholesterol/gamma-HCH transport system substrate-binding protein